MKKRILILATVLLVAATTITIVSCKKDKTEEGSPTENIAKNYELSDMDKAMIAFGEKMKAASNEKSEETMPLAEALNTLSNYQNFTMCDASNYSMEMLTDTIHASLNITEGEVSLCELNRFYETTKLALMSKFNYTGLNQRPLFCIETVANDGTRYDPESLSDDLNVDVIVRTSDTNSSMELVPYNDTTLSWYDFEGLGLCDIGDTVMYLGWDCVRVISARMHPESMTEYCGYGFLTYYTNIQTITIHAYEYPDIYSPNGRYAIPWRSFWDDEQCVSPDEIAYYINSINDILEGLEEYYMQSIIDFSILNAQYFRDENYNLEAKIIVRLADINCSPVIPD